MEVYLSMVKGYGGLGGVQLIWGDKEVTMQYLVLKGSDRGACKPLGDVMVMLESCLVRVVLLVKDYRMINLIMEYLVNISKRRAFWSLNEDYYFEDQYVVSIMEDTVTASEIDDIISAKLPSQTDDTAGYKVVTEYMLNGPCCMQHSRKSVLHMASLNDDREWTKSLSEASLWALGPQLRDIFITMLFFYDVVRPLKLSETNWQALSEDILHKKRKLYKLRSERRIALAVASSGIASLLLPAGRIAHSRFVIPLDLMENSTCRIKQNTQLTELMQEMHLIIWDEAPMTQRYAFEALDITLRDILGVQKHIKKEPNFWGHDRLARSMRVNEYCANGEIDTSKQEFNCWVLAVGDGTLPAKMKDEEDEATWIDIPKKFLIKTWDSLIQQIVAETYPDFTSRQTDNEYLKERAILTPRNDDAEAINEFMFKQLSGEPATYYSADEICKASTDNIDQHQLYPIEFLNSLNFPGMPPHAMCLKKNYQSCLYKMSIQAKAYAMELD
ncbi:ATP-dependent DNA helicase PIF1-like protein [Tanacetum coccineum]